MLMVFSIVKISYFRRAKIRSFYIYCNFFTHYFAFFFK